MKVLQFHAAAARRGKPPCWGPPRHTARGEPRSGCSGAPTSTQLRATRCGSGGSPRPSPPLAEAGSGFLGPVFRRQIQCEGVTQTLEME